MQEESWEEPRKKGKGCMIALIVFGALMVPCIGGAVFFSYKIASNPDVQKIGKVVGAGIELAQKAQNAPGAREVRALGCQQAMVISAEDFKKLAGNLEEDDQQLERLNFDMVQCQLGFGKAEVSCPQVAETFLGAVESAPEQFVVQVTQAGKTRPVCQEVYNNQGEKVRDLEPGAP